MVCGPRLTYVASQLDASALYALVDRVVPFAATYSLHFTDGQVRERDHQKEWGWMGGGRDFTVLKSRVFSSVHQFIQLAKEGREPYSGADVAWSYPACFTGEERRLSLD